MKPYKFDERFPDWPHIEGVPLVKEMHVEAQVTMVYEDGRRLQGWLTSFRASGEIFVRLMHRGGTECDAKYLRWGWV